MDTTIDTSAAIDDNTEGSDALEELNDNSENTKNISKPKGIKVKNSKLKCIISECVILYRNQNSTEEVV
jgi:hypothetical protein